MIADDMMSYIKSDIVVFGIGVFIFINFYFMVHIQKYKMGYNAFIGLCNLCCHNDWIIRFNWMESNCYIIKLYCTNVNIKYGNEYTC